MSGEVATNEVSGAISKLSAGEATIYSSMQTDSFDQRKALLKAVTNSTAIADILGSTIELADIIIQPIELEDARTGLMETQPRIVLVDAEGKAFHAVSQGVFKAVQNLIAVLGQPSTWPGPVAITVNEVKGNKGFKFFTFDIV